jgi:hypothetical protein
MRIDTLDAPSFLQERHCARLMTFLPPTGARIPEFAKAVEKNDAIVF